MNTHKLMRDPESGRVRVVPVGDAKPVPTTKKKASKKRAKKEKSK